MTIWGPARRLVNALRGQREDTRPTPAQAKRALSPRRLEMQRLRKEARQAAKDFWTAPSTDQAEIHSFTYRKATARLRELKAEERSSRETERDIESRPGRCWFPGDY